MPIHLLLISVPENYIFPLYQFDTAHKSFILNIYLKENNSPALALLLAALRSERCNNASFFKIENPRRFFFCLPASLQQLLCTTINE